MSSAYQKALNAGYSVEEINAYLSQKHPNYQKALDAGYSPEEISNYLSSKNKGPSEGLASNIGRQVGRTGARVAETILGAPRALGELGQMLIPEKAIGALAGKVGLRKPTEKYLQFAKDYSPSKLLPKSEDIRKNVTRYLFGEKLEPKNEWEKKADDLVSDFAALALPMPGSQLKVLKPAMLALGANAVSEGIGQLGGTEKQKAYGKIGTIVLGSLINPGSAEKLKGNLYKQAKESRPADAIVNADKLEKLANELETSLVKGDPDAVSKKKSLSLLKHIKSKIKNKEIEVEELEKFKKDINEARSSLYEEFKSDKIGRKSAKKNLDSVSNIIDKGLREYGKVNPEWESFYRPANEVHGAIAQSHKARNWIFRHAKKLGFPALLAELGLHAAGGLGASVGAAGAATLGFGSAELISRIMKSPTLRKHYVNLINGALKEDAIVVKENLRKIQENLDKD